MFLRNVVTEMWRLINCTDVSPSSGTKLEEIYGNADMEDVLSKVF